MAAKVDGSAAPTPNSRPESRRLVARAPERAERDAGEGQAQAVDEDHANDRGRRGAERIRMPSSRRCWLTA